MSSRILHHETKFTTRTKPEASMPSQQARRPQITRSNQIITPLPNDTYINHTSNTLHSADFSPPNSHMDVASTNFITAAKWLSPLEAEASHAAEAWSQVEPSLRERELDAPSRWHDLPTTSNPFLDDKTISADVGDAQTAAEEKVVEEEGKVRHLSAPPYATITTVSPDGEEETLISPLPVRNVLSPGTPRPKLVRTKRAEAEGDCYASLGLAFPDGAPAATTFPAPLVVRKVVECSATEGFFGPLDGNTGAPGEFCCEGEEDEEGLLSGKAGKGKRYGRGGSFAGLLRNRLTGRSETTKQRSELDGQELMKKDMGKYGFYERIRRGKR